MKTLPCLLSILALSGCATSHPLAVKCPTPPAVPLPLRDLPPPGEFEACMAQIIQYGRQRTPISAACLQLMHEPQTKL